MNQETLNVRQSSPLISVLMPVRNAEAFLPEALQSLLSQTYADFEILIINDGSTDGGMEWIAAVDDSRIRILGDERQLGIAARLNQGIEAANGSTSPEWTRTISARQIVLSAKLGEWRRILRSMYWARLPHISMSEARLSVRRDQHLMMTVVSSGGC